MTLLRLLRFARTDDCLGAARLTVRRLRVTLLTARLLCGALELGIDLAVRILREGADDVIRVLPALLGRLTDEREPLLFAVAVLGRLRADERDALPADFFAAAEVPHTMSKKPAVTRTVNTLR
jgi:hypothetical protein